MNVLIRFCFYAFLVVAVVSLGACHFNDVPDLEPSGPITRSIDNLFWLTVMLMSLVMIPVFGMAAWFIWQYRASNSKATYTPNWDSSVLFEWAVWLFPASIIVILTTMTWIYTHRLDPSKPLKSVLPPLEIQVIALDWKWLFIYPQQNIAAVNELSIPVDRPITFRITSNTVMNSFFIPRLGGQIYAMAGMETHLHLIVNKQGQYFGENIQYSGRGFPYQNFEANATTARVFDDWVEKARQSALQLNLDQFNELAKPSIKHPVIYYASVTPALFEHILAKFMKQTETPNTPSNSDPIMPLEEIFLKNVR